MSLRRAVRALTWHTAGDWPSSLIAGNPALVDLVNLVGVKNTIGNEQWDKVPWGCFYFPYFMRNVNCFGAARADVARAYPQFGNDAKQGGFFFAVDTDYLLQLGFARGLHYMSVQVRTFDLRGRRR